MAVEVFRAAVADRACVGVEQRVERLHVVAHQRPLVTLKRGGHLSDDFRAIDIHDLCEWRARRDRTLTLVQHGQIIKTYKVTFGRQPTGRKEREGDDRTPEGRYVIDHRNLQSKYHIALHVSYPNADDARRARAAGTSPGGEIMIHGLRSGFGWLGPLHRLVNWTHGCIDSLEGLYYESSGTTPYHFLTAAEISQSPSDPMAGLPYGQFDLRAGLAHMRLLGVRYYMAFSQPEVTAAHSW